MRALVLLGCVLGLCVGCQKSHGAASSPAVASPLAPPDGCESAVSELVAWEAETILGLSPRAAFEGVHHCQAELTWSENELVRSDAPSGQTQLTLDVELARSSATLVKPLAGARVQCPPLLLVSATLHSESADGFLREQTPVTLVYSGADGGAVTTIVDVVPAGALQVESSDQSQLELQYLSAWRAGQCAGSLNLVRDEGGAHLVSSLGSWSSSGCSYAQRPTPLGQSSAALQAAADELAAVWGDARLEGHWDDGTRTDLHVQAALEHDFVCESSQNALLPIVVRYGTSDGRLTIGTAKGHVVLLGDRDGHALALQADAILTCESPDGALGYANTPCAKWSTGFVWLRLTHPAAPPTATAPLSIQLEPGKWGGEDRRLDSFSFETGP